MREAGGGRCPARAQRAIKQAPRGPETSSMAGQGEE